MSRPSRCLSMPPGSTFSIEAAATGPLQASRLSTTVAYTSVGDPLGDHINLHRAVTGRTLTRPAPHSVPGRVGESVLLPPDRAVGFDTPGVVLDVMRLPLDRLGDTAAAHYGLAPDELSFTGFTPLTPALARYWEQLSRAVHRELLYAPDTALANPLLADQTCTLLATAVLAVFPHSGTAPDYRPGPGAPASALQRAVDHLHDHPAETISVTELAAVAGVTRRALQYAFRSHYDTTPLGYHRRVRLEAAHNELLAADPAAGDTVNAIAGRWGFGNPTRFARYYQQRYGHPPARTLRT